MTVDSRLATDILRRIGELPPGAVVGYFCANLTVLAGEIAEAVADLGHTDTCMCAICRPVRRARALKAAHDTWVTMISASSPESSD